MKYQTFYLILISLFPQSYSGFSQQVKVKTLDINLVPGFGTTGLDHNLSRNYVSLNLLSGYSDQTLLLQLSAITGSNRTYTGGLHIAGIGNFTGVNVKSIDPENFEQNAIPFIHMQGIQIAGLINLVRGDVAGGQASILLNITQKEMIGVQMGGLLNYTGGFAQGFQMGIVSNYVAGSMSGIQLGAGMNKTGKELYGIQVALINSARTIEGKNSMLNDSRTGLQVGALNLAVKMNGFQIGLVNYAKKMQGTQIGLINIGQGVRKAGEKQGTYIGLINVGDILNLSVYSSELFLLNTALYTGVLKNGQIKGDFKNKYLLNGLTWSKYPANASIQDSWAIGYGITRLLFNRNTIPVLNERYFYGYHFRFYHISRSKSFEWNLNEILQIGFNAGFKVQPKVGIYGFVSLNLNTHIVGDTHLEQTQDMIPVGIQFMNGGNEVTVGPGINLGLLVH